MPYLCFLSYSNVNRTKYFDKFRREFDQVVREKTGEVAAEITFFAPSEIKSGQEWEEMLAEALRTSKVIVCLCSPHYFSSKYCGKELEVFLLRRRMFQATEGNAGRRAGIIFPLVWEWPTGGIHRALKEFQQLKEGYPKAYVENGLNAILRLRRETDLQAVIIKLAQQINEAVNETRLPDWPQLPPFDEIRSVFHDQPNTGRYQYALAVLHPDRERWQPFGNQPLLQSMCEAVAAQTSRFCRPIIAGSDFVEQLRQSAEKRETVVVVTDLTTIRGPYHGLLRELNAAAPVNWALFVLPGDAPAENRAADMDTLRSECGTIFAQPLPHNWLGIRTKELLSNALIDAFVKVSNEVAKADPVLRFSDETLAKGALESGIRTDTAPVLSGPQGKGLL